MSATPHHVSSTGSSEPAERPQCMPATSSNVTPPAAKAMASAAQRVGLAMPTASESTKMKIGFVRASAVFTPTLVPCSANV
jgi:hypothetical protein